MCGRYVLKRPSPRDDEDFHQYWEWLKNERERYNIAPSQGNPEYYVPIVRHTAENDLELARVQWWLLPYWSKSPHVQYATFNARAEDVVIKPAFRGPLSQRRCLVPASGWYKWEAQPSPPDLPWYIYRADGRGAMFAGLWDRWKSKDDDAVIESCSIIVTKPNAKLGRVHHRMPVVLDPNDYALWLDRSVTDPGKVLSLLKPAPDDALAMHRVSTRVNNATNDGWDLIEPLSAGVASLTDQ